MVSQLQFSSDNTNWDNIIYATATASVSASITSKPLERYFRVVYTNGAVAQTGGFFRLQTLLSATPSTPTARALSIEPVSTDLATVNRSIITAKSLATSLYGDVSSDAYGNLGIVFGGAQSDAFQRGRVGLPQTLFATSFKYDLNPLLMNYVLTSGATVAKTTNISSATLSTGGTVNGADAVLQSKEYWSYEPGKSQFIALSGVIGAYKQFVRSMFGYFDANDGVFFDMDGTSQGVSGSIGVYYSFQHFWQSYRYNCAADQLEYR